VQENQNQKNLTIKKNTCTTAGLLLARRHREHTFLPPRFWACRRMRFWAFRAFASNGNALHCANSDRRACFTFSAFYHKFFITR